MNKKPSSADSETDGLRPPEGWRKLDLEAHTSHLERIGPIFYRRNEDGNQQFAARVQSYNLNYAGHSHGGMLMSLADFAACSVAMKDPKDVVATISFNCEFIQPGPRGALVVADVEPVRRTETISFLRGQIKCRHRVLLNFSATVKRMRRRETSRAV
ncbi:MAG: PaaI family thioesterase [Gammaproteobacteria bacterium]